MEIRVKNCLYFLIFNIIYVVIIIIDWVKKGEAVENINEIEWDIEGIKLKEISKVVHIERSVIGKKIKKYLTYRSV